MNTKEKTKRLTISLLCCGRSDTIERCLKSVMPLREKIDSELQVIDTGCDKETRAIIEKYADEVFEFTWCNDFAKARNFQLDMANGEWLLYLDDDEFFLDTKPFYDFFLTDTYKEYNIGGYYQRNYLDKEGKQYSDVTVIRMASITPETNFYGKVHEFIRPAVGNTNIFDVYAGHFGYLFESKEDNIRHTNRNIPLLKEMIKEDPKELRWPYQLAQEYRSADYDDLLLELCQEYLDRYKTVNDPQVNIYKGTFVIGRCIAESKKINPKQLKDHYVEVMADDSITPMAKAKYSLYIARQYYIEGDFEHVEEACDYYIKVYNEIHDNPYEKLCQGGIFVYDAFESSYSNTIFCYKIVCGLKKDDLSVIPRFAKKISWSDTVIRINRGFVVEAINAATKHGAKKEILDLLKKFFIQEGLKRVLMQEIKEHAMDYSLDELAKLKSCFKKISGKSDMEEFVELRYLEKELLLNYETQSYNQLKENLLNYAKNTIKWYDDFTKTLEDDTDETDVTLEVKLARNLEKLFQNEDDDYKIFMNTLKESMGMVGYMNPVLSHLSKLYGEYQLIKSAREKDPQQFDEMYKLEEAVLAQIAELEAAGHDDDAMATRNQLEAVLVKTYGLKTLH